MADLLARIGADVTDFDRKMKAVTERMKEVGKRMQSVGKTLSLGLTAPLLALGGVALKAFDTQIKAEKKLQAALRSTGQDVESNFKDFKRFASELQEVSLVGDEATLQMLQLATSMGLNASSAKRASKNAIAMASALGINEKSAIKMTAALEQGDATMLTRYLPSLRGIEDQTERAAEAQRLLAQMFGTVTAEAQDGLGPLTQMTNTVGDLMEQFGAIIAEGIKPFVNGIKDMAERFQELSPETKGLIVKIGGLAAAIGPLLVAMGFIVSTIIPALITGFAALTAPIGLIVAGIAALGVVAFATFEHLNRLESAQDVLNDTMDEAKKSISGEISEIDKLITIANSETLSRKKRQAAIDELQSKYPNYLKNIDLESLKSGKAQVAIDKLKNSLLKMSQARAIEAKIQELQKRRLDAVTSAGKSELTMLDELRIGFLGITDALTGLNVGAIEEIKTGGERAVESIGSLDDQIITLIDSLADLESQGFVVPEAETPVISDVTTDTGGKKKAKVFKPIEGKDVNLLKEYSDQLALAQEKAKIFVEEGLPLMQEQLNILRQTIESGIDTKNTDAESTKKLQDAYTVLAAKIKEKQEDIAKSNQALAVNFGDLFASVATTFATGIGSILSGTATMGGVLKSVLGVFLEFGKSIGQLMIKLGAAGIAAKKLALNPVTAIAAGIALIAITSAASSALAKGPGGGGGEATQGTKGGIQLPSFATGTNFAPGGLALVGEIGPEVVNLPRGSQVIPNNKLGGGGQMELLTRITAQDIEIILKRKGRSDGFA